jgi:hypothetical protein
MTVKANRKPKLPTQPSILDEAVHCPCGRELVWHAGTDAYTCPTAGFHETFGHTWFLGGEDVDRYRTGWRP